MSDPRQFMQALLPTGLISGPKASTRRGDPWEKLLFEATGDHLPLGAALLGPDFVVRRFNRHYAGYIESYSRIEPRQAQGQSYFTVVPNSLDLVGDLFRRVREVRQRDYQTEAPLDVQCDGRIRRTWWDVCLVPVVDRRDRFDGLLLLTREVTERVSLRRELSARAREIDILKQALRVALAQGSGNRLNPLPVPGPTARPCPAIGPPGPSPRQPSVLDMGLTPREIQVARLIGRGESSKHIADSLYVSKACVDFHRHNIRQKLGLVGSGVNLASYLSRWFH